MRYFEIGSKLVVIKSIHTIVWVFFVLCIVAIPVSAYYKQFTITACFVGAVLFEVIVLLMNRWSCPLTGLAAQYTTERQENFDIYLPLWLAKYNKLIFGWLFVLGTLYAAIQWWMHPS
jgi:hypothetical protein